MLPNNGIATYADLPELRKDCQIAARKQKALAAQVERLCQETDQNKKQIESYTISLAVTERQIRDIQKDIFLMQSKQSRLSEASLALLREIENKETQVIALRSEADEWTRKIASLAADTRQMTEELAGLELAYTTALQKSGELEKERHAISNQIAEGLGNTSSEWKDIEARMIEQNDLFLTGIDERVAAESRLSEHQAAADTLSAAIYDLEQNIRDIEDIQAILAENKGLQSEIAQLEAGFRSQDEIRKDLLARMTDRRRQLDAVLSENAGISSRIAALESEVGVYEKMKAEAIAAQAANDSAKARIIQVSEELMDKLARKAGLEETLEHIWVQFDLLSHISRG